MFCNIPKVLVLLMVLCLALASTLLRAVSLLKLEQFSESYRTDVET